jgi:SecD/SecF fusion protein
MTTDEVVAHLAQANPVPESASPTGQERAEAERVLRRLLDDAPPPRRAPPRLGLLAPVVSVLVVVAVAAVVLRAGGTSTTDSSRDGALTIALRALPTPQAPRVTAAAMSREVTLMRRRLASLDRGVTVRRSGARGIVVSAPKAAAAERGRIVALVTQPAQLRFYDWEANVLTRRGTPAADGLLTQDRDSIALSTGGGSGQAGIPGPGGMSLYQAVRLAARQRPRPGGSRVGPAYYLFGAPGSAACVAVAKDNGTTPVQGQHCLLSGPDTSTRNLYQTLAPGVSRAAGELVTVPQGTVVLQAGNPSGGDQIDASSPGAQFYVLEDHVALTGNDITDPRPSVNPSGSPDVTFGFTGAGQSAFQRVTGEIAHRGANVSLDGQDLNQHFAVALDNQLLTVPQIDFHQYPDGIVVSGGSADITGGFSARSARDLAIELRYGALPLAVRVVP